MATKNDTPIVAEVLADLHYPAEKWQITSGADIRGADLRTRRRLYDLPARQYADADDVMAELVRDPA